MLMWITGVEAEWGRLGVEQFFENINRTKLHCMSVSGSAEKFVLQMQSFFIHICTQNYFEFSFCA